MARRKGTGPSRRKADDRVALTDALPFAADPELIEVLSIAAHELRTPTTVILGLASTLVEDRGRMSEEQIGESLHRIDRQAKRLVGLLEDLLDVSRIQTGRMDLNMEPVELGPAVSSALAIAAPPPGKSVTIEVPEGLTARADAAGLERVLVNLLTNAYRYGGTNVRIEGRKARGGVRLSVLDDGPGVPEDLRPYLFRPFRAQVGGTGLGLSIVLGLVDAFGGTICYEPAQPAGSRFDVTLLPVSGEPHARAMTGYASSLGRPVTVLIVDDEPDVLFLLRLTLETAGYDVVEAAHGEEALRTIRSSKPEVVVTDLMMPVMDGRELIRHVRAEPDTADLPIMLLSANPDHSSGADRVMRKPFNPRDLTRAIDELIGSEG
jgi:CheY-like chemotaxis protein